MGKTKLINYFYIALIFSVIIHIFSLILGKTVLSTWRLEHDPLHACIEISGSLIAILVSQILVLQEEMNKGTSYNNWIAGALIGMGTFDGAHAFFHAGQHFVLFHSLATFWGGILFLMVFLPRKFDFPKKINYPKFIFCITTFFILILSFVPAQSLGMISNGEFTPLAKFLNLAGGILLIAAAIKIYLQYRITKKVDDILFFLHCLLFGLAATMFQESKLWDFPWWSWHILRLAAYITALYFCIIAYAEIKRLNENESINELQNKTEERAKIGSWNFNLLTNELKWSDQTYRIHEIKIGSKVDVSKAINFYHPDYRDKITKHMEEAMKNHIPWDDEFKFITAKGKHLWVRAIGQVQTNTKGEVIAMNGSFQDISAQKKAVLAKDRFLSVISHEMRTPLTSIIGVSELLNETPLSENQKEYTLQISNSGKILHTIINDVLDLTKLENDSLKIVNKPFHLKSVIEEVTDIISSSAQSKGLDFIYDYNVTNDKVYCDPLRIRQICFNILGNSLKFTKSGFIKIIITEQVESSSDDELIVKLELIDSGIGIKKEFLPNIFIPFEQGENEILTKEGTGLGLAITKSLIDKLNGKIKVESDSATGTKFTILLPLKRCNKTIEESKKDDSNIYDMALTCKSILCADDTDSNKFVVKGILKNTGCNITFVSNGHEAYEKIVSGNQYNLILMDILMPVLDGISATELIRKFEKKYNLPKTPIIAFSAFTFEEDKSKAIEAGCDDYLTKPIRKKDLFKILEKYI